MTRLWQGETDKAIENFPISGERVPVEVVRMLARVKAEAARVNAELGLLEPEKAERIAAAAEAVAAGEHDDQFPIDVFQTGSGTSTNTNVNEVIVSQPSAITGAAKLLAEAPGEAIRVMTRRGNRGTASVELCSGIRDFWCTRCSARRVRGAGRWARRCSDGHPPARARLR